MTARLRTGYSFRNAVGNLTDIVEIAKSNNWSSAPITDRGSTFGFVKWRKACKAAGLKPVYGVELAVSPSPEEKKPRFDHWTFLAIDDIRPLNELVSLATRQFRYESLLTYEQALSAVGVFKIIGRRADLSLLPSANTDKTLFVAASPSATVSYLQELAKRGIRPIACGDNVYPTAADEGFYQILVGRGSSAQTYPQHIMDDAEWKVEMLERGFGIAGIKAAMKNRDQTLAACKADLPRSTLLEPAKPKTLRQMCIEGAARLNVNLKDPVYAARLDRELAIIAEKKFEDYFYVVSDMVMWARARMTVGPARGSSAGSLACYLLGITLIDPIPYGLLFERFISLDRPDMPDIDCDFSDEKRDLVFSYLADTYGKDRMARLGTVTKYGAASALKEAGGALDVPPWEAKPVMEAIVKRSSGDARKLEQLNEALHESDAGRALLNKYPGMVVAARLESHPRNGAQHACGVVLTNRPIIEYVAIDARTGSTQCDKKDAEDLDLLKIDCLGLTQLSVFEDALALANLPHDYLDGVPLDDPAAFAILNDRKFAGIFQFGGPALKALARLVTIDKLEDFSAINALARPGTLSNGAASLWAKRRMGKERTEYFHPSFKPITEDSHGIILYQEQVMIVGREIGNLSWEDVSSIRRSMSKSLGKEYFDQFGTRWKAGAIANGLPESILNKIWDDLCSYGAMSFNKSHSVAYGIVSYWCCWLKAHYPLEFCAATLQHETDPDKQISFLREISNEGIGYVPVNAEHSTDKWHVAEIDAKRVLVGPIGNVVGLGPKLVHQFVSAKARNEPMPDRVRKLLEEPVTPIDSLWPIRDAFARVMPDPRERNIFTRPVEIGELLTTNDRGSYLVFCTIAKLNLRDENELINVIKRGGKKYTDGKYTSLNIQMRDDTGTMFGKLDRFEFPRFGKDVVDRGMIGNALYAIKGDAWGDENFRGLSIKNIRFIGTIKPDKKVTTNEGKAKVKVKRKPKVETDDQQAVD